MKLFHQAAGLLQPIDESLVDKIHDLVSCGVNRVSEMERHLQYFVKKNSLLANNYRKLRIGTFPYQHGCAKPHV